MFIINAVNNALLVCNKITADLTNVTESVKNLPSIFIVILAEKSKF